MTDKEKLEKLNKLADAMYYAAQYLTTDASRLHKAMNEYHQFIINEYHKEEPINYDKLNTMLDDALAKETKESLNERLGISQEEHDRIVDKYLYGKEPELVDVDDLPKEEPVNNDFEMALAEMIDKAQTSVVEPLVIAAQWKDELIKLAKSEEPVSDDLEKEIEQYCLRHGYLDTFKDCGYTFNEQVGDIARHFVNWQKKQLMASGTDVTVHIEAGNYPYIPQIELYDYDKDIPLAKEGDKYKVVLIKDE